MQTDEKIRYFLGANSPQGFYSLFDQLIDPAQARAVYILKGGPGCGKSSLMHRIAQRAEEAGETVEYIQCSGDPASLDAVLLSSRRVAVVDGTAPHGIAPEGHFFTAGTTSKDTARRERGSSFYGSRRRKSPTSAPLPR